jgi:acetyl-CoA carboxylase carboxyltransferase component
MEHFIRDLEASGEKALNLGGQAKIDLQHSLGRLTARERIDKLVDPATKRKSRG